MVPRVISAPTVEPITWMDVVEQSAASDEDQAFCEKLIKAARQALERHCNVAFIEQELEIYLDAWPCKGSLELPWATPLQSITEIAYRDYTGDETVLEAGTDYIVDTSRVPGRVAPAYGKSWPSATLFPLSPIRIRYIAGEDAGAEYPHEDVKHALRYLVGHFYDNREAVVIGENVTVESKQVELSMQFLAANHINYRF